MKRNFLPVGTAFTNTSVKQTILDKAIAEIEWLDIDVKNGVIPELPFSQGYAIREMVKNIGNKVDKVGHGIISYGRECYAILAIRNNYTAGDVKRATLYAIDEGTHVTMIATDTEDYPEGHISWNQLGHTRGNKRK